MRGVKTFRIRGVSVWKQRAVPILGSGLVGLVLGTSLAILVGIYVSDERALAGFAMLPALSLVVTFLSLLASVLAGSLAGSVERWWDAGLSGAAAAVTLTVGLLPAFRFTIHAVLPSRAAGIASMGILDLFLATLGLGALLGFAGGAIGSQAKRGLSRRA